MYAKCLDLIVVAAFFQNEKVLSPEHAQNLLRVFIPTPSQIQILPFDQPHI
jgi:hypothetical protein